MNIKIGLGDILMYGVVFADGRKDIRFYRVGGFLLPAKTPLLDMPEGQQLQKDFEAGLQSEVGTDGRWKLLGSFTPPKHYTRDELDSLMNW
jgi:hypothetical protein